VFSNMVAWQPDAGSLVPRWIGLLANFQRPDVNQSMLAQLNAAQNPTSTITLLISSARIVSPDEAVPISTPCSFSAQLALRHPGPEFHTSCPVYQRHDRYSRLL
jgi:hypothetical protein